MVKALPLLVCVSLLSGAIFAETRPVDLSICAVHATQEARETRYFDAGLEFVRAVLLDLPFNVFHLIKKEELRATTGQETRLALDERYTLFITPIEVLENGSVRMDVRIDVKSKKPDVTPIKALQTRMLVQAGKKVKFRGLKLDEGEMVLVLGVRG